MYAIKRNGKAVAYFKNILFPTYEMARQALRSYIRTRVKKGSLDKSLFNGKGIHKWDGLSRNPVNITKAGYTITNTVK